MMVTVQEENRQALNLVRAMLGSITPNFRAVYLECTPDRVQLYFVLETESAADREEINVEIVGEFLALQEAWFDIDVQITVSTANLSQLAHPHRAVYRRREHWYGPDE